jgi:hypothetical protein
MSMMWWMRSSIVASATALIASACSVGTGTGELTGSLLLRDCNVDVPEYSLRPSFFAADYITNLGAFDGQESPFATIRVQRGSYRESLSDGLLISLYDVNAIARDHLGEPIELTAVDEDRERLVDITFYAGQTCDAGYPDEFWRVPGNLHAVGGTITFLALHAPDLDGGDTEISAILDNAEFATDRPDQRHAVLSGSFRFFYQRGAPAQSFP